MCKKFYSIIPYQSAFSRFPSHRKNHINFCFEPQVSVNKSNYFHLIRVEQAINLWAFPLGSKSFILVFIVLLIHVCRCCVLIQIWCEWQSMRRKYEDNYQTRILMISWYKINVNLKKRKMEKVHVLEDNCQKRKSWIKLLSIHFHCLTTVNYVRINKVLKHQLINRLNNARVKFNLCILIIIASFQIYTLHEIQHLV